LVDPEAIRARLHQIDRRIEALAPILAAGREWFLEDETLQAQAERHVQIALQAAIDVANHILAEDFPDAPSTYREVFPLLARRGVLPPELADRLASATGLRNILVHDYLEIDPARLWEDIANTGDLVEFSSLVIGYIST
jgi:uncharacterized protein YutE (UPF0331/DUF86 family)